MNPTGDSGLLAGRYRLGPLLGRGGMAEVYDGFDERLARPVAVKLLRPSADAAMRQRFEREARSAARLTHPSVVAVYDSGEDRDRSFLVMERLPGETLADRMRAGPVDPAWLATIAADVAAALSAAHSLGIVHRDIKPANILLTAEGRAKVADFGIAKTYRADADEVDPAAADLTATGLILGTVAYLAPEQIDGAAAGPPADLYALGVVLYEALAGRKPYTGDNPIAQARAAHEGQAADLLTVRPGLDPRLAAVVRRAMARNPEDRYASAAAMRAALVATGLVAGEEGVPEPTVVAPRPAPADTVVMPVAPVPPLRRTGPPGPPVRPPVPPPYGDEDDGRRRAALVGALIALAVVVIAVAVIAILLSRHHGNNASTATTSTSSTTVARSTTSSSSSTSSTSTSSTSTTVPSTTTTIDPTAQSLTSYATTLRQQGGSGPDQLANGLDQVAATTPGANRSAAATTVLQQAADLLQAGQITQSQYDQADALLTNAGASPPTTTTTSTTVPATTTTPPRATTTTAAG